MAERTKRARVGSSREAFIAATGRLLRRRGYAASGLNDIVALSGAPKGSLYFHFPGGKEELAVAAMECTGEDLRRAIEAILSSSPQLGEALAALVDALAVGLASSGYQDGCPIATVTLEAASGSEAVRDTAAGVFDSWLNVLEERLQSDGQDEPHARRRALLVLSALEGALILARARRDPAPLQAVREELLALQQLHRLAAGRFRQRPEVQHTAEVDRLVQFASQVRTGEANARPPQRGGGGGDVGDLVGDVVEHRAAAREAALEELGVGEREHLDVAFAGA